MKVAVVTGTRAEYGIWRPVLRALRAARGLEVQLVVTGMHLLAEFGSTAREIACDSQREGWSIAARVPMYRKGESAAASLARRGRNGTGTRPAEARRGIRAGGPAGDPRGGGRGVDTAPPAGPSAWGRDRAGQWDEQIRHAVTKMAQLHFCATASARRRIIRMGEDPRRVHRVGAPALDEIRAFLETCQDSGQRAKREAQALVLLHPTLPDETLEEAQARMLIEVLRRAGRRDLLAIGPNNDPGHRGILRAFRAARVPLVMSLGQDGFWREMCRRGLLVGNSSSGIIEAASLRCAVVNIGDRQAGRERSGNVLDVPWVPRAIRQALDVVLSDRMFRRHVATGANVYGDGRAAPRIVDILRSVDPAALAKPKLFVEAAEGYASVLKSRRPRVDNTGAEDRV